MVAVGRAECQREDVSLRKMGTTRVHTSSILQVLAVSLEAPMDISQPIRAVIPTLDGPVLVVLAGTRRPLTTLEIHRLARVGSSQGVRRALERLASQGVVRGDHRGNAIYYVANRDHVAWPAIEILARLRATLRERLVEEMRRWEIQPIHGSLFGSAARGDGDATSDIDILLVKPDLEVRQVEEWDVQVDGLRERVHALTGNRCQAFVLTRDRLAEHVAALDPLVKSWADDGVHLVGARLGQVIGDLAASPMGR